MINRYPGSVWLSFRSRGHLEGQLIGFNIGKTSQPGDFVQFLKRPARALLRARFPS